MSSQYNKKVYFTCNHKNDIKKLKCYETTGKDMAYLRLNIKDSTHLLDILKTFPNIQEIEFTINDYNEDIRKEIVLPHLRTVHFGKVMPMDLKNFWNIFSNLEEVTIGNRDNYDVFTSEFVNRVIGRNAKSLRKLRLLDIPLVKSTFRRLRVPMQLEELEIIFFSQQSKEKICRSQNYWQAHYEKQKYQKKPGKVFFTKEEELTTFDNLKHVIQSQNELISLMLDEAEIDSEMIDIIASRTTLKYLKVTSPEFKFNEIGANAKEFFHNLEKLYLSHISESSSLAFKLLLENLKEVEILELHCIWSEVDFDPPKTRILLPKLKELHMHCNNKSESILDNLQFTDKLESISADINSVDKVEELLKTSPSLKRCLLYGSSEEVANFVLSNFQNLEWFEVSLGKLCLDTVILIMNNAGHLKRARILLYHDYSREEEHILDDRLQKDFPGFFFYYKGATLEMHNKDLDFKMRVGYHHFMQGGWDV